MPNTKIQAIIGFPSINELMEFEQTADLSGHHIDKDSLSISGAFMQRDIELALSAYQGKLLEHLPG